MDAMANFFEWINQLFGVQSGAELVFHPIFIGIAAAALIYALIRGMKVLGLTILGLMGGAAGVYYLYPENSSNLTELVKFLGAMGGLALILVYFGFIRE